MDEAEKQEEIKRGTDKKLRLYPIVEIPSDAQDVSFSYSLVYSLCMFLSEEVRQRKHKQPCLLQCSHASSSYWISSACQFDAEEVAETVLLLKHLSA